MSESAQLPSNFGGIAEEGLSSFDGARVVVWPVSYEGTVSYGKGTGRGAEAIIDASRNMELYDEEEVVISNLTRPLLLLKVPVLILIPSS